ncbi:MAG: glycosyltransferase family 4 protein [Actinobacteria bacterium]|nr:glycosyltransferase family 4 protein [Actinomycetota bacterium]
MRITHVVVSDAFAGTERYVAEVARRLAQRGHDVLVVGGDPVSMPGAVAPAAWQPASDLRTAAAVLARGGRPDVVHAHLTAAETAAFLAFPRHRAPVVSTRHIATRRGSSTPAKVFSRVLNRFLRLQIAISEHVGASIERAPDIVLWNGVPTSNTGYDETSRVVLAVQRLEPEKDAATAIRAWAASGLDGQGWELQLAGDGSQRAALERLVVDLDLSGVRFLGAVDDVPDRLAASALVLASSKQEGLGLAVLEAMAAARPVVATAVGGHLETLPAEYPGFFPVGDAVHAGQLLRELADDPSWRRDLGGDLRARQRASFDVEGHVDRLIHLYSEARRGRASV